MVEPQKCGSIVILRECDTPLTLNIILSAILTPSDLIVP